VREHVVFGGRLPLEPSGFTDRALVRDTPAEFADLRDWNEIRAWATGIAVSLLGVAADPETAETTPSPA